MTEDEEWVKKTEVKLQYLHDMCLEFGVQLRNSSDNNEQAGEQAQLDENQEEATSQGDESIRVSSSESSPILKTQ